MENGGRRDWCFTAWREPEFDRDKTKYITWGLETCPTTNKEHYQGFIITNRTCRRVGAGRVIGAGSDTHIEPRRGTRGQARDYARKDGRTFEWGRFESLTLEEILKLSIQEIREDHLLIYLRYHKGLEKIANKGATFRKVMVTVLWGMSGTGKTKMVMEMDDVYKIDYPYKWWDGYEGQKILLIDDYRQGTIETPFLLNLLDGYRLRLETKGSHTWALWEYVYITTNDDPKNWSLSEPLQRRITDIIKVECEVNKKK